MLKNKFLLLLVGLSATVYAQKPKEVNYDQIKSTFPDKQAVILNRKEEVRITLNKADSVITTVSYYSEMLHLQDRTEGLAEGSVSFSDFVDISKLDARSIVPVKNSFKTVKVSDITVQNPKSGGIFFDDTKLKVFTYPGVQPKATTILAYEQRYKEPRLLSPYYFTSYVPVLESELVIYVDKRINLGYRLFNDKSGKIKFTQSTEGNFQVYRWKATNLSEYTIEEDAPSISYFEPHVVYFIEEVTKKSGKEIVLKETKDLYNWYYSIALNEQSKIGPELRGIVDSLTAGATTDKEKTRRIFYWVQDHVKYVAFEEGYGGFIPRDANLVCDRRYGDCKDMANLLVQMLKYAGVKAHHVWIGTRDIPYSYNELPAPNVDNHMIATAFLDGKYVYLDATGKYTRLGLPSSFIQGKEALIGLNSEKFEISKVPVVSTSENYSLDTTYCYLDNTVLKGKGILSLDSYNKIDFTYSYNYSKKDKQREIIKDLTSKGSNKYTLNDYSIENIEEKEKPIKITYDYAVSDYVKSSGNEVYINVNLTRIHDKSKIDTLKRKLPYEYDYKYTIGDVVYFTIPAGYKVDYLPASVKFSSDFFTFEINYSFDAKNNRIVYSKKSILNTLMMDKKDFTEWNKLASKISQAYREVVVLKKQ